MLLQTLPLTEINSLELALFLRGVYGICAVVAMRSVLGLPLYLMLFISYRLISIFLALAVF